MSAPAPQRRVAVVVPARDEVARLAATVRAARSLGRVDLVVVVDDGSRDGTADAAREAGAVVVRHPRSLGKAAAMTTGALAVAAVDQAEGLADPRDLLFLDADLAGSATGARSMIESADDADVVVGLLPSGGVAGGGFGLVVQLSRAGIRRATGWEPQQPLSGQRLVRREAFDRLLPLAPGFGVETGMTVDALRQGLRVVEVETTLSHRVTGRTWSGFRHRGRQFRDVLRALVTRTWRSPAGRPRPGASGPRVPAGG